MLRLVGLGHDQIRATHTKTLELSADASITARATCVIAVGMTVDAGDARLAGPVRIALRAGEESFSLHAVANSSWDPADGAVIRRSGLRLRGTLATDADAAASDLPAPFVNALRSPDTIVEAIVHRAARRPDGRAGMMLLWSDPSRGSDPRLAAEIAAADLVLGEDGPAIELIARAGRRTGRSSDVGQVVQRRGRVLAVATCDLPGASVVSWLGDDSAVAVDVAGLPPPLAAAAASPARGPLVVATATHDLRELLRTTPAANRICLAVSGSRVAALLALAVKLRGNGGAVVAQQYAAPQRATDGRVPALPTRDTVFCCLDGSSEDTALDPAVGAAIAGLVGDGVSTRTAARALAELSGWPSKRAYDYVLGMNARRP